MDLALEADVLCRAASGRQRIGILPAFVAQRVETGCQHQRRRQPGQIGVQQRRGTPIEVLFGVEVMAAEKSDRVAGQHVALTVAAMRRCDRAHISGRVDQQLELQRNGLAGIAPGQRHRRCEVATCAVTAHRKALRIEVELASLGLQPAGGRQHIVDRCGEALLRTHPVIDRDHGAAAGIGQIAAKRVVGVEVTNHPPATVVVNQCRCGAAGTRRAVQAQRDVTVRTGGRQLAHFSHRPGRGLGDTTSLEVEATRVLRCQRVCGGHAASDHHVEQRLGLRIEHLVSCWGRHKRRDGRRSVAAATNTAAASSDHERPSKLPLRQPAPIRQLLRTMARGPKPAASTRRADLDAITLQRFRARAG